LDYDGGSAAQNSVVKTYEQAFITAFGQPDPDQEWGFGTSTIANTRGLTRGTRTLSVTHNFSADAISAPTTQTGMQSTNFLSDVPTGVLSYTERCQAIQAQYNWNYTPTEFNEGDCYIDGNYTGTMKINSGNSTLYVKGNCDMTDGRQYALGGNMTIYLVENATFTIPTNLGGGSTIYIAPGAKLVVKSDVSTGNVNYYNNGGTIEVDGNMVVNGGMDLFCEGGTLKVGGLFQIQTADYHGHNTTVTIDGNIDVNNGWLNGSTVYSVFYQDGGSLTTGGNLICNSGKFYSNVNTEFTYIEANGPGVIYNGASATMESKGAIKVTNGPSVLINDGTLKGTSLGTEGSASFQNNGETVISGETRIDSNQNTWVNNGHYTTNDFTYRAMSDNVVNNCHLKVNNLFSVKLADTYPLDWDAIKTKGFRMDAGCGVETKDFEMMGPGFIHMGSNSVFKVSGTASMGITKDIYGIYGPVSGDYAVFEATNIVRAVGIDSNQGFVANYFKNLYVVTDNHFDFGWSNVGRDQWEGHVEGQYDQPYYRVKDGAFLCIGSENRPNITITPTTCNPGYSTTGSDPNPNPTPDPDPTPNPDPNAIVIRVICEDLTVNDPKNDFDFNDAVFDVKLIDNKVDITLRAAGGTLPLYIGDDAKENEIHYAFETTNHKGITTGTMLTTETPRKTPHKYNLVSCLTAKLSFDLNQKPEWLTGWSEGDGAEAKVKTVAKNIPVLVRKLVNQEYTLVELQCEKGKATAKVGIKLDPNNEFKWCDERVNINDTFSYEDALGNSYGGFTFYVQGFLSENEWYQYNGVLTDDMVRRYLGQ
jgi:hypothetical protein